MQNVARVLFYARQAGDACQTAAAVLEYQGRSFPHGGSPVFCPGCRLFRDGRCQYAYTHLYGAFEAERWGGMYIYSCPANLTFIATALYDGEIPQYAMILGPMVIGDLSDIVEGEAGDHLAALRALPVKKPEEITAISQVQSALCAYLAQPGMEARETAAKDRGALHNALYDAALDQQRGDWQPYPLALEKQLQRMITQGDRQGAQELINQLLGKLYFSEGGDFHRIKENAKGLVVLFSRAALEGGADARQIFGDTKHTFDAIDGFTAMDELSAFLVSMFYRFVGYVFDFTRIKNIDLVHKVLEYVRAHYTEKITLDDVAAHVYLSRPYLSRVLSEELGMSFPDFVNSIRIEKSKELLLRPELSLVEISDLTGFSDQSYFTKVFHKQAGISPGEYRKSRGRKK